MFKRPYNGPWICSRCMGRQVTALRGLATASAQLTQPLGRPTDHTAPGAQHDDRVLRKIFDSPSFWKDFSQSSQYGIRHKPVGLFQNRYLTDPSGFETFTRKTLEKATARVRRIRAATSLDDYRRLVRDFDSLSDLLCRVIDLADFVRSTHPDLGIQDAATRAYGHVYEYMNVLNTMTELNEQLKRVYEMKEVTDTWSEEERTVMRMLQKDFSKSAINMPKKHRERFVTLSQEISELGTSFVDTMTPEQQAVVLPSSSLRGMDPQLVRKMTSYGYVQLPTFGEASIAAQKTVEMGSVRRQIYMASNTASFQTLYTLDCLLKKRAELAQLTNYADYGNLALEDKMAKSPEAVKRFLLALSAANLGGVEFDMAVLHNAKISHMSDNSRTHSTDSVFEPWDKEYYMQRILSSKRSKIRSPDFIPAYFSVGTVIQGLSRLFTNLYGMRFVPYEAAPGETWHTDVRRIDVVSETDGHVAVLYCDLFARRGKSANPSHFTLRCSREITQEELADAASRPSSLFDSPAGMANDGMATSKPTSWGSVYQLPTIALICNFATQPNGPSLLSFPEYQTLFHEMGHAIHSILGRTSFQNVAGTRCPTDFAELPSILMEHFAIDPTVLSLCARHHETDTALPYSLISETLAQDKHFESLEVESQILLSLLDQAYHSTLPLSDWFSSTAVYHHIHQEHGVPPHPAAGTSWQGFFTHLNGYGATYYSYVFDRVLAKRVWRRVFDSGRGGMAVNRDRGERFASQVLRWGGARDPWRCLGDVFGGAEGEILSKGNEGAMEQVGHWGLEMRGGKRQTSKAQQCSES